MWGYALAPIALMAMGALIFVLIGMAAYRLLTQR